MLIPVRHYSATTRTAEDAAKALGVPVQTIVKSLVFIARGEAVVVLCSGADRVDEGRLAAALGTPSVRRATAEEVKRSTGYAIGGVPPFAHERPLGVVCERRLLDFALVWAAAGLPDAVFAISPRDLVRLADATVADVAA